MILNRRKYVHGKKAKEYKESMKMKKGKIKITD